VYGMTRTKFDILKTYLLQQEEKAKEEEEDD
jgi:hypothetical protein